MGLAICLGVLAPDPRADPESVQAYREQFREVNRLLAANGLPAHVELEGLPKGMPPRGHGLGGFPYSWLHYFRRAVAIALQSPTDFCAAGDDFDPGTDMHLDVELSRPRSHLICHSDSDGFYVPVDFPEPLYDETDDRIWGGGILGSSQRALAEVILAAPLLGITLKAGNLPDKAARAIAKEPDSGPYCLERKVWLSMYEAFRDSVGCGCAVVFG